MLILDACNFQRSVTLLPGMQDLGMLVDSVEELLEKKKWKLVL